MNPILFIIVLTALILSPSFVEAATTNYHFDGNFTFDSMGSDNNSLILGSGRFEVIPTSSSSIDVTIYEFTASRVSFIIDAPAHIRITDGVFKVYDGMGYLLLLDGATVNGTTAKNGAVEFDIGAGNYTIKNGTIDSTQNTPANSGGGGGGGGGGSKAAASVFNKRLNVITAEMMADIIKELKLDAKQFCRVGRHVAAVFAVTGWKTGDYPVPETDVSGALVNPIIDIGGDVYETSASEVLKAWSSSDMVVIARGDLEVDSISSIAYAKARDIPILLTEPNDLPSATMDAVKELGANNFVIVGGELAVGSKVANELAQIGSVRRIAGKNRQETAAEVAKALERWGDIDTIIIADGEKPSMDAAIIASGYGAPVLYVIGDIVPQSTKDFIKAHRVTKNGTEVRLVFADVSGYIINYRLDKDF